MKHRHMRWGYQAAVLAAAAVAVGLALAREALAVEGAGTTPPSGDLAPPPSGSPPDLTGRWWHATNPRNFEITDPIPFQEWNKAINDKSAADQVAGIEHHDNLSLCLPPGPTDIYWIPYLFHVFQTPEEITILYEHNHERRIVYMNEQHPADLRPSWYGHSVGHWEGDTLVIDTIGLNDKTPVITYPARNAGAVRRDVRHSDAMHIVERWTLTDGGKTLKIHATIEDPKAFTAPWEMTFTFDWRPDIRPTEEVCAEANVHLPDSASP